MKNIILLLLLLFTFQSNGQENVQYISPKQLQENLAMEKRPAVVQFWIPNCATANEIVAEYKTLEKKYGKEIDFYFIGIANKQKLVADLVNFGKYPYPIYIADTTVDANLNERQVTFGAALSMELKQSLPKGFITLFVNKAGKVVYVGKRVFIKEKQLRRLLKK